MTPISHSQFRYIDTKSPSQYIYIQNFIEIIPLWGFGVLGLDWDWLEELEEPELESDSESELESELDELDGALGLAGVDVSGGGDGELEGAGERFCWVWVLIGEGVRDGVDLLGDPWGGLLEGDLLGACSDSEFASEPSGVLGGFLRRRSLDGM